MPTLLSIGHGYSAGALGRRLVADGWRVIGTTRSDDRARKIAADGVEPLIWDGGPLGAALSDADHLLTSVSPGDDGDPVLAAAGGEIANAADRLRWAGYLSTTGVYGDRQGGWVDETSDLRSTQGRSVARIAAEAAWRALPGLPLHIFRLAGIYGPGRGPFSKVKRGDARRILKDGQVFSRTHVEDIATVLAASIARPDPGAVYNVCDDEPAPPEDVLAHAADLLGVPVPPAVRFEDADLSPMARSFYAENRRVRNDRIKRDLGVTLAYPTYREGLAAILAAEDGP